MPERARTAETVRRLQAVSAIVAAAGSLDELIERLLAAVEEALEVDTVSLLLADRDRAQLVPRAARGLEEAGTDWRNVRIAIGDGFAGRIAASGRTQAIADIRTADLANSSLRQTGIRSLVGAPLVGEERDVIGVVHPGTRVRREFTVQDRALLKLIADRAAVAIERTITPRGVRAHARPAPQLRRLGPTSAPAGAGRRQRSGRGGATDRPPRERAGAGTAPTRLGAGPPRAPARRPPGQRSPRERGACRASRDEHRGRRARAPRRRAGSDQRRRRTPADRPARAADHRREPRRQRDPARPSTADGGRRDRGRHLHLVVSDRGEGLDERCARALLGEPDETVPATGLGLAIVKAYARSPGGGAVCERRSDESSIHVVVPVERS